MVGFGIIIIIINSPIAIVRWCSAGEAAAEARAAAASGRRVRSHRRSSSSGGSSSQHHNNERTNARTNEGRSRAGSADKGESPAANGARCTRAFDVVVVGSFIPWFAHRPPLCGARCGRRFGPPGAHQILRSPLEHHHSRALRSASFPRARSTTRNATRARLGGGKRRTLAQGSLAQIYTQVNHAQAAPRNP